MRNFIKQGNFVAALKNTNYLLAINSLNPRYYVLQGNLLYMMRRYKDALVRYKQAAYLSSNKSLHRHKIRMAEFQIEVRGVGEKNNVDKSSI